MRNITCYMLLMLSLGCCFHLQANTDDNWSEERCAQLNQSDPATPQLRQQHCSETASANIMPVRLDVQLVKPAAVTEAPVPVPLQRVQHNSTLETLGSAMLLVLVGFWLWMGRK